MDWLKNRSIKLKITLLVFGISVLAMMIAFILIVVEHNYFTQKNSFNEAKANAKLIAEYSVAPIIFDDMDGLKSILQKIEVFPHVLTVAVYDQNGKLLSYHKNDAKFFNPPEIDSEGDIYHKNYLHIVEPIVYGEVKYGSLHLKVSTSEMTKDLIYHSIVFGLILLIILVFVYILASKWQRFISDPILKLSELTNEISQNADYSVRLEKKSNDEIGELYDSFNKMLIQIEKRRDERDAANNKLIESNKQLENFAYVASHDLQEPLRKINSFGTLLIKHQGDVFDEKGLKYLNYMTSGAIRMKKQINDLLEFSRISTRGRVIKQVDLSSLVQTVIGDLSMLIKENNAKIELGTLPRLDADASQLSMVFHNLITNAIKFRGDRQPEIKIGAEEKPEAWIFFISDNGIGIDEAFSERIFEIFQRLHAREEYAGTGIGLALVKKIIQRHKGNIWFESELGKGTTFKFRIPKGVINVKNGTN